MTHAPVDVVEALQVKWRDGIGPLASLTQLTVLHVTGLQIDNNGLSVIRCAQGRSSLPQRDRLKWTFMPANIARCLGRVCNLPKWLSGARLAKTS